MIGGRRRILLGFAGGLLSGTSGCFRHSRWENPSLVYVRLVNYQSDQRTINFTVSANGESKINTQVTLESPDETPSEEVRADNAPYQRYFAGEWPDQGEYEVVARLNDVGGTFRTTQQGIDPESYFGFTGAVHPGRDVIGWFVETIEPDELETYRDWLDQYAETIE